MARHLAELPQTAQAFAGGEISYEHAGVLARSAEEVGLEVARDAEQHLLPAARQIDPQALRRATRHLQHCLDPDGYLDDSTREQARSHLHLSETLDGVFYLKGRLDPEGGGRVRAALDSLMTPAKDDQRKPSERRAAALVELADRQMERGELPEVGGQKPHLVVMVQQATLAREPGSPAAELDRGQPLAAEVARRIACDACRTWVTIGPHSELLQMSSESRVIPPAMRRAMVLRDRTCRWPGCEVPAIHCDGHHLSHWADGGTTELDNVASICRRHHHKGHEEGWILVWGPHGELIAIPP